MLRHVDAEVEALVAHLQATRNEPLTVFCLSDHGFDTIGHDHPVRTALIEAGFIVDVQPVIARAGILAGITDLVTRVLGVVRSTLLGLTRSKPGSTGLSIGRNTELERRRSSKYR